MLRHSSDDIRFAVLKMAFKELQQINQERFRHSVPLGLHDLGEQNAEGRTAGFRLCVPWVVDGGLRRCE